MSAFGHQQYDSSVTLREQLLNLHNQVGFELVIFVVTWWNALSRPRENDVALAKQLYWDGSIVFFVRYTLSCSAAPFSSEIGHILAKIDQHDHLYRRSGVFFNPLSSWYLKANGTIAELDHARPLVRDFVHSLSVHD